MDFGWRRRLRPLNVQLIIVCIVVSTFAGPYFLRFVFQGKEIAKSSISVYALRRIPSPRNSILPEATVLDGVHPSSSVAESGGNKTITQLASNFSRSMDGCPEGWHYEILREANDQQDVAQICRSNSGNDLWKCAPGWRQLSTDPFCVRSTPLLELTDQMSTIRQPEYAPVSHSRKLHFIHVPKAGGTSIETSFLFKDQRENFGGHYLGGHGRIIDFDERFFKSYHKFCIVRHPCSRLISVWAYYSQDLGNNGDKDWVDKFMDNETKSSFDAFIKRTLYPGGLVQVDKQVHLQTQVGMIFDKKGQFGLDQLLIFEKWKESMDELGKRINVNVTALSSKHRLRSHHKTCQESYSSKTWYKMTQIYAMDFCVLGYSTEIEKVNVTPPIDLTPEYLTSRFYKCSKKIRQGVRSLVK